MSSSSSSRGSIAHRFRSSDLGVALTHPGAFLKSRDKAGTMRRMLGMMPSASGNPVITYYQPVSGRPANSTRPRTYRVSARQLPNLQRIQASNRNPGVNHGYTAFLPAYGRGNMPFVKVGKAGRFKPVSREYAADFVKTRAYLPLHGWVRMADRARLVAANAALMATASSRASVRSPPSRSSAGSSRSVGTSTASWNPARSGSSAGSSKSVASSTASWNPRHR